MSSQRKIDSARANGAKSHGPKTPDGKRKSCKNAIKHGLTARTLVLSLEDLEEFEALRDTYLRELQPQNQVERDLVDQMINSRWHTDRICTMETAELDLELSRQEDRIQKTFDVIDHETRLAIAFKTLSDDSHCLALLNRYEARHRRNYEGALRLLLELRGPGLQPAAAPDPPPPEPPTPEFDWMQNETSITATLAAPGDENAGKCDFAKRTHRSTTPLDSAAAKSFSEEPSPISEHPAQQTVQPSGAHPAHHSRARCARPARPPRTSPARSRNQPGLPRLRQLYPFLLLFLVLASSAFARRPQPLSALVREPAVIPRPEPAGQHDSAATLTSITMFQSSPRSYYRARYLWAGDGCRHGQKNEDAERNTHDRCPRCRLLAAPNPDTGVRSRTPERPASIGPRFRLLGS